MSYLQTWEEVVQVIYLLVSAAPIWQTRIKVNRQIACRESYNVIAIRRLGRRFFLVCR